jgi:hypothetical protein
MAIVEAVPKSIAYHRIESKIRLSLEAFTSESHTLVEEFISHIRRFIKRSGASMTNSSEQNAAPTRSTPSDYPRDVNIVLYDALQETTSCTCMGNTARKHLIRRHQARLLLKPERCPAKDNNIQFDMLFSSTPSCCQFKSIYWQDIELLVPR